MDDGWISVEDRLPELHQKVLVFRKLNADKDDIQLIKWWDHDEIMYTHWKPVEPPKETP